MKNKYILLLLSIIIFSCEKTELEDINDIIEKKTEILVYTHEIDTHTLFSNNTKLRRNHKLVSAQLVL